MVRRWSADGPRAFRGLLSSGGRSLLVGVLSPGGRLLLGVACSAFRLLHLLGRSVKASRLPVSCLESVRLPRLLVVFWCAFRRSGLLLLLGWILPAFRRWDPFRRLLPALVFCMVGGCRLPVAAFVAVGGLDPAAIYTYTRARRGSCCEGSRSDGEKPVQRFTRACGAAAGGVQSQMVAGVPVGVQTQTGAGRSRKRRAILDGSGLWRKNQIYVLKNGGRCWAGFPVRGFYWWGRWGLPGRSLCADGAVGGADGGADAVGRSGSGQNGKRSRRLRL